MVKYNKDKMWTYDEYVDNYEKLSGNYKKLREGNRRLKRLNKEQEATIEFQAKECSKRHEILCNIFDVVDKYFGG